MKIKFKLSIMVIAIMAVVVTGISFLLLYQASAISTELSLEAIFHLAQREAKYWEGREDKRMQMLNTLAHLMADYEGYPVEIRRINFDNVLFSTLKQEADILELYTIWKPNAIDGMDNQFIGQPGSTSTGQYAISFSRVSGEIVAHASDDVEASMAYFNGPNSKKDRVEQPFTEMVGNVQVNLLRMMVPIINPRTNETVGGVGCLLNTSVIQPELIKTISENDEIAMMIMYSNNGFVLAHFLPERIGKMMPDADPEYGNLIQPALKAVNDGTVLRDSVYDPILQTILEFTIVPVRIGNSDTTWSITLGTTRAFILKDVNRITRFTIILSIVAIVLTAAVIYLVLSSTIKPIVTVADTLKDIAQGEGDLTKIIPEQGKDEVTDLAHFFNQTMEKIKHLIIGIKQQAMTLTDIGEDLASNMTETAAAINEITANVQSIKSRVMNQSASVTQTNTTMEQITVNINKLNGHVENQSSNISQASSAIEEMVANIQSVTQTLIKNSGNVKELMDASEVGRSGLSDVASDIQEITRESEGLLEINAVMENIASQTNLLSMNAAIEAAHAGEAGKGFAVVADEIRKLAEKSSEQSKTISTVLKKIKGSIDKITVSTDNVLKKFEAIDSSIRIVVQQEENIRAAMEEQETGSQQILKGVSNVNDITRNVKIGSEEMLEGSKEVIQESMNLEKVTLEISGGMNEMASGAEQINVAINSVNELSSKNRENIDLLVREVSRFKVE
jgi:methyl-accepting chemotaxis protein